jgi:hypothetical protein
MLHCAPSTRIIVHLPQPCSTENQHPSSGGSAVPATVSLPPAGSASLVASLTVTTCAAGEVEFVQLAPPWYKRQKVYARRGRTTPLMEAVRATDWGRSWCCWPRGRTRRCRNRQGDTCLHVRVCVYVSACTGMGTPRSIASLRPGLTDGRAWRVGGLAVGVFAVWARARWVCAA